jgi:hypothetical protein
MYHLCGCGYACERSMRDNRPQPDSLFLLPPPQPILCGCVCPCVCRKQRETSSNLASQTLQHPMVSAAQQTSSRSSPSFCRCAFVCISLAHAHNTHIHTHTHTHTCAHTHTHTHLHTHAHTHTHTHIHTHTHTHTHTHCRVRIRDLARSMHKCACPKRAVISLPNSWSTVGVSRPYLCPPTF